MTWLSILVGYLVVGAVAVFTTPARAEATFILGASDEDKRHPVFPFVVVFIFALVIVLWPWVLYSHFRAPKPQSAYEALMELSPLRQQTDLLDIMGRLSADGTDADELPPGVGEFGRDASNPIPCKTIYGATAYLSRLRSDDGAEVLYDRVGCVLSDVSPHPIDCYAIRHPDGRDLGRLYISPYQNRNSGKSPRGFSLLGGV